MGTVRKKASDSATLGVGIVDAVALRDPAPRLVKRGFRIGRILSRALDRRHKECVWIGRCCEQAGAWLRNVQVDGFVEPEYVRQQQAERFSPEEVRTCVLEAA